MDYGQLVAESRKPQTPLNAVRPDAPVFLEVASIIND